MKTIALALLAIASSNIANAQPYWVVETNAHQKNFTIVRFYDGQNNLIFEERQMGVVYNPLKQKHQRKLNAMLNNYLMFGSVYSKKSRKEPATGKTKGW